MSSDLNHFVKVALKDQNLAWPADDVVRVIRAVQMSVDSGINQTPMLVKELAELSRFIEQAKSEIASVRADEITNKHIPTATDELDAIIGATEEATGAIMDACEKIEELVKDQSPELANNVVGQITQVYEACTFQDITGQRITKVVKALKAIDQKVVALLKAFGGDELLTVKADEDKREGDERLLNGPQLNGQGVSQDDIDKLF